MCSLQSNLSFPSYQLISRHGAGSESGGARETSITKLLKGNREGQTPAINMSTTPDLQMIDQGLAGATPLPSMDAKTLPTVHAGYYYTGFP